MAITVPKYNRQVEVDTPRYQDAPSIPKTDLSPNMRSLNVIGQANQNLADTGVKIAGLISKHMQERVKQKQEAEVSAREVSYRTEIQDLLYSKEPVKIKSGDQEIEAPAGYMNRQLDQAQGSTIELESKYKDIKNKYLSGLKTREQYDSLSKSMDSTFLSARGMVINNEGDQFRKSMITKHEMNASQQISSGALIGNAETLNGAIDNLNNTYSKIGSVAGWDADTLAYNQKDKASGLVSNAVNSFLLNTGDLKKSKELLDSAKDKILPDQYEKIEKHLNSSAVTIKKNLEHNALIAKTQNRFDMINGVATGKINWDNSFDTIKKVSVVDSDLAEAMQKVVSSDGKYTPESQSNDEYQKMVSGIFSSSNNEEVSKFLIDAMNSAGNGKISRDRLAILVNAAQNRAKALPQTHLDGKPIPPTQIAIDGGVQAIVRWNEQHANKDPEVLDNYMGAIQSGKTPVEAYNLATDTYKTKINPAKTQYQIGQIINNPKTGLSAEVIGYNDKGSPLVRVKRATASKSATK